MLVADWSGTPERELLSGEAGEILEQALAKLSEHARLAYRVEPGRDPLSTEAPQRGQCFQSGSSGFWQDTHVCGEAAAADGAALGRLDDASSSTASPDTPFLNSCIDLPRERAISGSRFAPKKKAARTKPMMRSCVPNMSAPPGRYASRPD
jgi:hypothetical protein